jgi:hypothetical protein
MQQHLRPILIAVLLGAACSSGAPRSNGNTGGSEEEGGTGGGESTGGKSGTPTGGKMGGTGGSPATGGETGTGGAGTGGGGGAGAGGSAPDAGAPDAVAAGGSAGGGCGAAKVCLDFENQTVGAEPTGMFKVDKTGGATVTVDGSKAFSGTKSVVLKKAGGYPGTFLTFSGISSMIPSNDLHGRVMMWMTKVPGGAHWDGIWATGSKLGGGTATYILGGMYMNFMAVYHPGDCSTDSKTPFPVGRWACIQWEFKGTKDGKHLHKMMLDGKVVDNGIQDASQGVCASGGGTHDWAAPIFNTLKVGYVAYGGSSGDIWFDDLAFGEQEIPCPPMPMP